MDLLLSCSPPPPLFPSLTLSLSSLSSFRPFAFAHNKLRGVLPCCSFVPVRIPSPSPFLTLCRSRLSLPPDVELFDVGANLPPTIYFSVTEARAERRYISFRPSIRIMACAATRKYSSEYGNGRCLLRRRVSDEAVRCKPEYIYLVTLLSFFFIVYNWDLYKFRGKQREDGKRLKVKRATFARMLLNSRDLRNLLHTPSW